MRPMRTRRARIFANLFPFTMVQSSDQTRFHPPGPSGASRVTGSGVRNTMLLSISYLIKLWICIYLCSSERSRSGPTGREEFSYSPRNWLQGQVGDGAEVLLYYPGAGRARVSRESGGHHHGGQREHQPDPLRPEDRSLHGLL